MLDLETLGVGNNPVIISIGAVEFDTETMSLGREFEVNINPQSCVDAGLEISVSTVMWWMQQSEQARKKFIEPGLSLKEALYGFDEFVNSIKVRPKIWGNGVKADNVWMESAYKAVNLQLPWTYKDDRCYRTIRECFPSIMGEDIPGIIKHHALSDAKWQANHPLKIIRETGLKI